MLSRVLLYCINRMMPQLKETEIHQPLIQTATTANGVERRKFQVLSHGLFHCINRMMRHLKESETHQPLIQTATTVNRMKRRFQGVVAWPFILYQQKNVTSQGIRDLPTTDIDSYDSE